MHLMFPVVHSVSLLLAIYSYASNRNPTHATGLVYTAEPSRNSKQLMRATKASNDTVICSGMYTLKLLVHASKISVVLLELVTVYNL